MFKGLIHEFHLVRRLMIDRRIPLWKKAIPVLALVYVISPLDLIPDVLIGLGQLDDLGILLGSIQLFKSTIPDYILREHLEVLAGQVIEVKDYEVIGPD
jgi:uncharacterized membrane protein YkvA (DUF1232 family)